jgi:putative membrane protein
VNAEALGATLAAVNATLNGSAALLLVAGWRVIKSDRARRRLHGWIMGSAFATSVIFLASYLTRVYVSGTHRYPGGGAWKAIYLAILSSHMLLAVVTPPLAVWALMLAWRGRFDKHRRVVRWAFPIWLYVSVTGVAVYLLLYHPPG